MTSNPCLQVRQLAKRFGDVHALREVSFDLGHDELLVVLGPTGAGKTTLLRAIAGLDAPDAGSLLLNGQDITRWPSAPRDVALVFQNFSLYPDMTVRRNLAFPLLAPGRNMSRHDIQQRVAWAADLLRITHLLDRKAAALSGGEMQRVAIGRAIVRRPRLFLMDEPLTNLDAKLRESLRVELIALRRQLATPMILVTHDQAEALSMADRIVVLSQGQVLQTGSPEQVYHQPASPLVARQLGQPAINLLHVAARAGRWTTPQGVAIAPASEPDGCERLLGIRPENLAITGGDTPATIRVVEDMGPVQVLLLDWAGLHLHAMTNKSRRHRPGDTVHPAVSPEHLRLWPASQD